MMRWDLQSVRAVKVSPSSTTQNALLCSEREKARGFRLCKADEARVITLLTGQFYSHDFVLTTLLAAAMWASFSPRVI